LKEKMMIRRLLAIGSACASLAAVGTASAQQSTPEQGAPATAPPRADQPILPQDIDPVFGFEGGVGILGFFDGTASIGPLWQVRARAHFSPSWSIELNYMGSVNDRDDNDATMVTTQIDGSVRYDMFRSYNPPVQPFVTVGLGYAGFSGDDGDMAAMTIPVGIGVDRALTRHIRLGGRFNFNPVIGEDLDTPQDRVEGEDGPGGDNWSVAAHLGGQF
jgi:Outer membrane protein beta-barrel domain